jgi:hypothetical protein
MVNEFRVHMRLSFISAAALAVEAGGTAAIVPVADRHAVRRMSAVNARTELVSDRAETSCEPFLGTAIGPATDLALTRVRVGGATPCW